MKQVIQEVITCHCRGQRHEPAVDVITGPLGEWGLGQTPGPDAALSNRFQPPDAGRPVQCDQSRGGDS